MPFIHLSESRRAILDKLHQSGWVNFSDLRNLSKEQLSSKNLKNMLADLMRAGWVELSPLSHTQEYRMTERGHAKYQAALNRREKSIQLDE